jgi:RIO-like serine/threonine protein kinase
MRSSSLKQARSRRAVENAEKKVDDFIETMQNLAKIGVFIFDIHGDNLMVDADGLWKIVDIGVSEVGPPVTMEVL